MKILTTGATGFLGGALVKDLVENTDHVVILAARGKSKTFPGEVLSYDIGDISQETCWIHALSGIEVVIHCAGRVHIMNDLGGDSLTAFREVNTAGTLEFARQALIAGVKRFIFISSIKVNGELTLPGSKFTSTDEVAPQDPYGISKAEAEEGLMEIAKGTGMEVVIIRPPLVYGPGVKGNFLNLLKVSKIPVFLPFGMIDNKRSMVYLDNLVDLIITCIDHPKAANRVFLASDGEDLSLARLLTLIRQAMNKSAMLLPIPPSFFNLLGKLSGKSDFVGRLISNLQVDSSDANKYLCWTAPYSVEQGIKATVDDFLKNY